MKSQLQTVKPTLNQEDLKLIAAVVGKVFEKKLDKIFDHSFPNTDSKKLNKNTADFIRKLTLRTKLLLAHK